MQALPPTHHCRSAVYQVFASTLLCFCVPARDLMLILGWPKSAFGFFHNIGRETPNGLFGQPNTANVCFVAGLQVLLPGPQGNLSSWCRESGAPGLWESPPLEGPSVQTTVAIETAYRVKLTAFAFCFFFFSPLTFLTNPRTFCWGVHIQVR